MQYQPLSNLMLCDDAESIGALQAAFAELRIVAPAGLSGADAIEAMRNQQFDLLLVDLDGTCAMDVLAFQTSVAENQPRLVVVFSQDTMALTSARKLRVHFVLRKPFTSYLMARTLKAAYHLLLKGRRIPHRQSVHITADATFADDPDMSGPQGAMILDISYSGLCMQMKEAVRVDAVITLDFRLPGSDIRMHLAGQIRWSDAFGKAGVEFLSAPPLEQEALHRWLDARCPWDVEIPPVAPPAHASSAH